MRNKIIGSIIGGCLLIAAANPPKPYNDPLPITTAVEFCRVAHAKFQGGDKGAFLDAGMARLGVQNKKAVAVVCYAYGAGYDQGRQENNT